MSVEVWIGTPNEIDRAATKDNQAQAIKWARDWLDGPISQGRRYDNASADRLALLKEQIVKSRMLAFAGDTETWDTHYMDITIRLQLRKT